VLTLVKHIEPSFHVAEALEDLATEHPVECVETIRLMVVGEGDCWEIYGNEDHFKRVLATAIASGNQNAKAAADDLIQYLVTKGQFSYRTLIE
jgi:hypothetical protein